MRVKTKDHASYITKSHKQDDEVRHMWGHTSYSSPVRTNQPANVVADANSQVNPRLIDESRRRQPNEGRIKPHNKRWLT
jgi:hypothetical protein